MKILRLSETYWASHPVIDLGLVDLDLDCSTIYHLSGQVKIHRAEADRELGYMVEAEHSNQSLPQFTT